MSSHGAHARVGMRATHLKSRIHNMFTVPFWINDHKLKSRLAFLDKIFSLISGDSA
jgi:hypothetical protein